MKKSKAKMMESPQLTAPEGALEDAQGADGNAPSGEMRPDPEVVATASRRQFSNSDKRRILDAADRCDHLRVGPHFAGGRVSIRPLGVFQSALRRS